MFTIKPVGAKIHALRKNAALSQEQLAEKVGVSWRTISNLETGRTTPKIELIYAIAQTFHISLDELLNNHTHTKKSLSRIKLENQIIASFESLDDNLLIHISEYIFLLKKFL